MPPVDRDERSYRERLKAVYLAVVQIEKQFGKGSIMRLGQKGAIQPIEAIPTGAISIDFALGIGGVPRGRVVEIFGPESSGKTTLALQVIAEAQKQVAGPRDPFAVHHVELGFAEGRRHLVLDDLYTRAPADHDVAILDARDAADVHAHRRIELERAAAGGRFRVAEHDADLLAELVDEDQAAFRLGHGAGELPERLRHEARLQTHL